MPVRASFFGLSFWKHVDFMKDAAQKIQKDLAKLTSVASFNAAD